MPVPVRMSAVMSDDPMEILPKPEPNEPEINAPTEVKEEPVTPPPRAAALSTWVPPIENTPPAARLMLDPPVIESPPAKEEVAEESEVKGPAILTDEEAAKTPPTLKVLATDEEAEETKPLNWPEGLMPKSSVPAELTSCKKSPVWA